MLTVGPVSARRALLSLVRRKVGPSRRGRAPRSREAGPGCRSSGGCRTAARIRRAKSCGRTPGRRNGRSGPVLSAPRSRRLESRGPPLLSHTSHATCCRVARSCGQILSVVTKPPPCRLTVATPRPASVVLLPLPITPALPGPSASVPKNVWRTPAEVFLCANRDTQIRIPGSFVHRITPALAGADESAPGPVSDTPAPVDDRRRARTGQT